MTDTVLAQSKDIAGAKRAVVKTPGEVSVLQQLWSSPKPHTNSACCLVHTSSSENVNDKRISISKGLPKTLTDIKYSELFGKHGAGILNVCGLENILSSLLIREKWNGITWFCCIILRSYHTEF